MGTDKILFRPVSVCRNSAHVVLLEIVPVPGYGAQSLQSLCTKKLGKIPIQPGCLPDLAL